MRLEPGGLGLYLVGLLTDLHGIRGLVGVLQRNIVPDPESLVLRGGALQELAVSCVFGLLFRLILDLPDSSLQFVLLPRRLDLEFVGLFDFFQHSRMESPGKRLLVQ